MNLTTTVPLPASDRQFLGQLQRSGPQTILQLCAATGVTQNAVRQRLLRLLDEGLISRESVSAGRGRPYHEYRVTTLGKRALGDDYASLAKLLWQEVLRLDGDTRQQMIGGLRQALVSRYRPSTPSESLPRRFDQLCEALGDEGFDVETDTRPMGDDVLPILREHHCPYHELAAEDRTICELEQSVFEQVLGVPMTLAQCCHDGHTCCEFEPATGSDEGSEATVGNEVRKR